MEQRNGTPSLWMLYLSAVYVGVFGFLILLLGDAKTPSWSRLLALGDARQVWGLGTILGLLAVAMQIGIAVFLPERLWADDGTNAFFTRLSYAHIVLLMALTALGEELFFRATIQSLLLRWIPSVAVGLAVAAAVFAVAHVRYVTRPVLLAGAWGIGLLLGWGYWFTGVHWQHLDRGVGALPGQRHHDRAGEARVVPAGVEIVDGGAPAAPTARTVVTPPWLQAWLPGPSSCSRPP
ncbi:type II CAAX prenyl endopeptidase Rce1 family protein [Thermaerobacter composti]|uniref:CPBP family glutamic-type intramembrane protease n=1 Tax=Thermaerobacter composti TaxID=554949 RepID=A0ABZ0QML9_9FIRM|nr:CPBP family glutamic-type intramembrane protease [Thermaerobacter composti]WPD18651.1 CPBP family glutamic-type intramembrane protease [Thermaerobacter composti]